MKYLWIILLCCISMESSKAQAYQKMLEDDNYWFVASCNFGCIMDRYWTEEDTLIGGEVFKFLNGYHYNRNMCLREDTSSRQVFFWDRLSNKKTLLYDFSLNVGDNIPMSNPISPLPANQGTFQVDSIVLRNIQAGARRHFYLSEVGGSAQTIWIEGVGSLSLINTPGGMPDPNGVGELSCFYQNGLKVYEADSLPAGPCDSTIFSNIFKLENTQELLIYPNPSAGRTQIHWSIEVQNINIELLDLLGRRQQHYYYQTAQQIELDFSGYKGLYILSIQSDQGQWRKPILLK